MAVNYRKPFETIPESGAGIDVQSDLRKAHALEYIAFHMGEINQKLDRLTAAAERMAASQPAPRR